MFSNCLYIGRLIQFIERGLMNIVNKTADLPSGFLIHTFLNSLILSYDKYVCKGTVDIQIYKILTITVRKTTQQQQLYL